MRSAHLLRAAVSAGSRAPLAAARLHHLSCPIATRSIPACLFSTAPPKASMAQIKSLRETSGAPITECRDALQAVLAEGKTDGSDAAVMQAAVEALRKKGISVAAKKSGRAASEGLVGVVVTDSGRAAALVELNSETDFAARNTQFKQLCANISGSAIQIASAAEQSAGDIELASLQASECIDASGVQTTVGTAVTNIVVSLRENIQLRRVAGVSVREGVVGSYTHNAVDTSADSLAFPAGSQVKMGRQGALVGLETDAPVTGKVQASLLAIANKLAMQIVATTPRYVTRNDIPSHVLAAERALLTEQANAPPIPVPGQPIKKATKPKDAKQVEKMVEGRSADDTHKRGCT